MRILCPVDQSVRDKIVLRHCARLAKSLSASTIIVNAVPFTRSLIPNSPRRSDAYVEAVVAGLREKGLDAEGVVERGPPASVIVSLAHRVEADLIVMATRGRTRSGLGKFVLGSVAEAVMATTSKPVLTLSEAEERAPADEKTRRQSAYLARVLWNRQARGLYTHEQVQNELIRLVESGLDEQVLLATYRACRQEGRALDWLDLTFQADTLERFLPDGRDASPHELPSDQGLKRAA